MDERWLLPTQVEGFGCGSFRSCRYNHLSAHNQSLKPASSPFPHSVDNPEAHSTSCSDEFRILICPPGSSGLNPFRNTQGFQCVSSLPLDDDLLVIMHGIDQGIHGGRGIQLAKRTRDGTANQ